MSILVALDKLYSYLDKQPGRLIVGYSGGLDSSVLLHGVACHPQLSRQFDIIPLHIDHGLSPNANKWQRHCEMTALALNLSLSTKKIHLSCTNGQSPEAEARRLRYEAFAESMQPRDILLIGQHQHDQTETLLLQLLRGAGPKGLAAMAYEQPFSEGLLFRPFLHLSQQELQDYAAQHELSWMDDESNKDSRFSRNYLRHEVIPSLEKRWPGIHKTVSRSAAHCASHEKLLCGLMAEKLNAIKIGEQLDVAKLMEYDQDAIQYLLRLWLESLHLPLPSSVKIQHIISHVMGAREDAMPLVAWSGGEVRRYRKKLYAMAPLEKHDPDQVISWDGQSVLTIPGSGRTLSPEALNELDLPSDPIIDIRFRCGGERLHIAGRQGSHSLKNLFQEWAIPPWERNRIPLVFVNGKLVKVYSIHN